MPLARAVRERKADTLENLIKRAASDLRTLRRSRSGTASPFAPCIEALLAKVLAALAARSPRLLSEPTARPLFRPERCLLLGLLSHAVACPHVLLLLQADQRRFALILPVQPRALRPAGSLAIHLLSSRLVPGLVVSAVDHASLSFTITVHTQTVRYGHLLDMLLLLSDLQKASVAAVASLERFTKPTDVPIVSRVDDGSLCRYPCATSAPSTPSPPQRSLGEMDTMRTWSSSVLL